MNAYRLKIATTSLSFFSVFALIFIGNQHLDESSVGSFIINLPGVKLERIIKAVDIEKILTEEENYSVNKATVKRLFDLHELDQNLITTIKALDYDTDFARDLRQMNEHMQGPFFAPEIPVELAFSDQLAVNRAQVCADSIFLNQSMTIATEDHNNMDMIESANEILLLECPSQQREIERIVVAEKFGARLLGTDKTPVSVHAIAKPIPTIRFIHMPKQDHVK